MKSKKETKIIEKLQDDRRFIDRFKVTFINGVEIKRVFLRTRFQRRIAS